MSKCVLALMYIIGMHVDCKSGFWSCFVLFFFYWVFFRYEWSKFALFYLVSKSFLEVKGGCMGTVETKGDSSQILKIMVISHKNQQWPHCSFSLYLVKMPHIVFGCYTKQPIIPQNVWVIMASCKRKNILQASFMLLLFRMLRKINLKSHLQLLIGN